MGTRRSLKSFGVAMALVALSAVTASVAVAAHTGHQWEVNGVKLANGATQTVGCEKEFGSTLMLTGTVAGAKLLLTAEKVECIEGLITQDIVGENGIATDSGKLKFSELKVDEPAGCGVEQPITTTALQTELLTKGVESGLVDTFRPASGTLFANIKLTGCAAAETYPVRGSVCGETNKIGKLEVKQRVTFSETIDKACTTDGLTVGGVAANISGEATNFLTGGLAGKSWGATAY